MLPTIFPFLLHNVGTLGSIYSFCSVLCLICVYYVCFGPSCTAKHLFLWKTVSSVATPWGAWLRTHIWEEEKKPAPGGNWTHDPKSFALQACALPLCYKCCPWDTELYNCWERVRWIQNTSSKEVFFSKSTNSRGQHGPEHQQLEKQTLQQRHRMPAPVFEPSTAMHWRRVWGGEVQEQLGLSDGLALHQGQLHRRGHGEIGFRNQILDPISNEDDSCTVFSKCKRSFVLLESNSLF